MEVESGLFTRVRGNVTPFNLTEYAYSLSKATGISIRFKALRSKTAAAFVDIKEKTIYLPRIPYAAKFNYAEFRRIKSLLNHECAHLLYPDTSYLGKQKGRAPKYEKYASTVLQIARTLDDLRIETLMGLTYRGIREDFKVLIEGFWRDECARVDADSSEAPGDFSKHLLGSVFWILQKHYRAAVLTDSEGRVNFIPMEGLEAFVEAELKPILDVYVKDKDLVTQDVAEKVFDKILEFWEKFKSDHELDDTPSAETDENKGAGVSGIEEDSKAKAGEGSGSKGEGSGGSSGEEGAEGEEGVSGDGTSGGASDDIGDNEGTEGGEGKITSKPTGPSEGMVSGDTGHSGTPEQTDMSGEPAGNTSLKDAVQISTLESDAKGEDEDEDGVGAAADDKYPDDFGTMPLMDTVSELAAAVTANEDDRSSDDDYENDHVPAGYDVEYDIMDVMFDTLYKRTDGGKVYKRLKESLGADIHRTRTLFERILLSEKATRDLITYSGTFVPRRATTCVTSPIQPRVYKRKVVHQDVGFDVSMLIDLSGSMHSLDSWGITAEGKAEIHKRKGRTADTLATIYPVIVTLAHGLSDIRGVNLEILGFTADYLLDPKFDGKAQNFAFRGMDGVNDMFIIKGFTDRDTDLRMDRFSGLFASTLLLCQNYDVGAVKVAASRLMAVGRGTGNRKLLIVLSDGRPESSHGVTWRETRDVVEEVEKTVPVFGIGLADSTVQRIYKNSAVVNDVSVDFFPVILNRLQDFIMYGK
jgi:cobalamin biosynthesis protein CobT